MQLEQTDIFQSLQRRKRYRNNLADDTNLPCCCCAQPCLTLCDPMDCRTPGSSVSGILQVRILEWVAISFSSGFSLLRDRTHVSCFTGRFFSLRVI